MQQSQTATNMQKQEVYKHSNAKNQYCVYLTQLQQAITIRLTEKYTLIEWMSTIKKEMLLQISRKTGNELQPHKFIQVLKKALSQRDIQSYIDILTAQDLQNLKNKKSGVQRKYAQKPVNAPTSSKRYVILTYMTNSTKYHYPLTLSPRKLEPSTDQLRQMYNELRVQLQSARTSALNDTQKSQSFSINYNAEGKNNSKAKNKEKQKQVDQVRSQNQILKAKLARLEDQVQKKKANIQIQAAIQRTKLLKQSIETANLELVDWKNNIQDQQQIHTQLKKQLTQLHKNICSLLQTQKQVTAKKKGEEVQKELNQVKTTIKKNNNQIQKLKKQLQSSKIKIKDLEIKAKKLNSEKQVIRKGRKGPYSSAGSVRSYNSFNSAGKRSTGSNASSSSKAKSNYSYNSYSYGRK